MALSCKFHPPVQIADIRKLEHSNHIKDFDFARNLNGGYWFSFNLTNQEICGIKTQIDYSKYKVKIEYLVDSPPKVFIISPELVENPKHVYPDKSLCLYHPSNFEWSDSKSIAKHLIPWTFLWVYFYEIWLKTGFWYGEEYKH